MLRAGIETHGQGDWSSIPVHTIRVIKRLKKIILDGSLLNHRHYKVRIQIMWSSQRKGVAPSPTRRCSSYWKGSFESPSTLVGKFTTYVTIAFIWFLSVLCNRVGWGSRIHRLHFCKGLRPLCNNCSGYDGWQWGFSDTEALVNAEHPFIAIAPRSTLAQSGSTW